MAVNHILESITSEVWAVDSKGIQAYMPLAVRLLKGKNVFPDVDMAAERERHRPYIQTQSGEVVTDYQVRKGMVQPGSVGVIKVQGLITKYDQWCGPEGTQSKIAALKQMDQHANVEHIILFIDSPGGMSKGTLDFVQAIRDAKTKITAYVSDGAFSAAWWIASACDEIVLNNAQCQVGSAGTYISWMDIKPWLEKEGVKVHEVYATKSTNKNLPFRKAEKDGDYTLLTELINSHNDFFLQSAKASRGNKLTAPDWDTGQIYFADAAIKGGLADRIADFDVMISGIMEEISTKEITMATPKATSKNRFPALTAALDIQPLEQTADGVHFSEEQIQALEEIAGNLVSTRKDLDDVKAELQTAKDLNLKQAADLAAANESLKGISALFSGDEEPVAENALEQATAGSKELGELRADAQEKTRIKTDVDPGAGDKDAAWNSKERPWNQTATTTQKTKSIIPESLRARKTAPSVN